jgi:hypothetical protein
MHAHENSVVAEFKRARGQIGRARRDSDRQREFRRTFQHAGVGAVKRARRRRDNRHRQTTVARIARNREHTSEVVVQGTTLIVRIIGTVLALSAVVMGVMMMHVLNVAAIGQVGSNILLVLECMLEMDADQRHDAADLGQ